MKLSRGAIYAAFAVAVAAAMGWSLRNGFVYDDLPAIVHNARVTDPARWHTILRSPYWLGTLWRPFTVAMFAVQWFLGHAAPWLFHLTSLLAYFAVGVALFRLMHRVGIRQVTAFAVTLLFLVHPVHVEAVANSVGQAELWAGLALVGATLVYVRARQEHTERRALPALLMLVALGIVSKEQGFIAPLLLAGAEWLLLAGRGERFRARIRLLLPVTLLAGLLFVVRGVLLNSSVGETPAVALRALNPIGRAVTFLGVIPEWARLVVWPLHLQADYGPPGIPVGGPMTLRHWLGLALLAGFVALFVRCRRGAPVAAFGLLWAAMALAPVSNLLTPTGIVMAERVLFIPTMGLAIALAAWLARPERSVTSGGTQSPVLSATEGKVSRGSTALTIVLTLWLLAATIRSATRVPTWSTEERFFTDITQDAPRAYRGWMVAAKYWDEAHDRPRAIADLRHAIELWPHDFELFERLGQIFRQQGHCDVAIPIFKTGLREATDASTIRAKLIECLLVDRQWDEAQRLADEGVAQGQDEFKSMQVRVQKMRPRVE